MDFMRQFRAAEGYHGNAAAFREAGKRHSLVFNLASVAVENYLLSICELHDVMPFNHSYSSLMNTVEPLVSIDDALIADIRSLDMIFGICSVDNYHHGIPEPEDASRALLICDRLKSLILDLISSETDVTVRRIT